MLHVTLAWLGLQCNLASPWRLYRYVLENLTDVSLSVVDVIEPISASKVVDSHEFLQLQDLVRPCSSRDAWESKRPTHGGEGLGIMFSLFVYNGFVEKRGCFFVSS